MYLQKLLIMGMEITRTMSTSHYPRNWIDMSANTGIVVSTPCRTYTHIWDDLSHNQSLKSAQDKCNYERKYLQSIEVNTKTVSHTCMNNFLKYTYGMGTLINTQLKDKVYVGFTSKVVEICLEG